MRNLPEVSEGFPVTVENLGSSLSHMLDFTEDSLWHRMDLPMRDKALALPVFLVNPKQMDTLYPRERLRFLDPRGLKELLLLAREEGEGRIPLRRLEEVPLEAYVEVAAAGLYMSHLPEPRIRKAVLDLARGGEEGETAFLSHSGPAIALCPERIHSWTLRSRVHPGLAFALVYYHELAHALMDTGPTPYGELWGRVVEESLANWVAVSRFQGVEGARVQRLTLRQPPEYRGYPFLGEALVSVLRSEEEWADRLRVRYQGVPWFWDEPWHWWVWMLRREIPVRPWPLWEETGWGGSVVQRLWAEDKARGSQMAGLWKPFAEALLFQIAQHTVE